MLRIDYNAAEFGVAFAMTHNGKASVILNATKEVDATDVFERAINERAMQCIPGFDPLNTQTFIVTGITLDAARKLASVFFSKKYTSDIDLGVVHKEIMAILTAGPPPPSSAT